jgi:hypothetical protein
MEPTTKELTLYGVVWGAGAPEFAIALAVLALIGGIWWLRRRHRDNDRSG